jgi:hypothetical protein
MKSIDKLQSEIRDFINRPRKQTRLLSDLASWNMLCSALDVIGDTELALEAYLAWMPEKEDGRKYLLVYGALQVMEVQQDALKYLSESLAIPYVRPRELANIRMIRSDSIGHPMRGAENKVSKSSFIQQFGLDQRAFTLMTVYSDRSRDYRHQYINVVDLLTVQRQFIERQLGEIVEKLRSEEMAHREKYKDDRLEDSFPDTLGYLVSKIMENSPLSAISVKEIKSMVTRFKEALIARGDLVEGGGAAYEIELVEYPLTELECYIDPGCQSHLNSRDANIFASFVKAQVEQLREMARQIDEDYASGV